MRVTSGILFNNFLNNIQRLNTDNYKYNEQVATGRRVNRPSDDPVRFNLIAALHSEVNSLSQFVDNTRNLTSRLETTDSRLNDASTAMARVITLIEQGASGTNRGESRQAIAKNIEAVTQELLAISDATVAGRRVFAGTRNTTDSLRALPNNPEGNVYSVSGMDAKIAGVATAALSMSVSDPRFLKENIYELNILDAAGNYQIINLDNDNTISATGTFAAPGDTVSFDGIDIVYNGGLSAGDSVVLTPNYSFNGTETKIKMQVDDNTFVVQNVIGPDGFGGQQPTGAVQNPGGTMFDDLTELRRALLQDEDAGVIAHIDIARALYEKITQTRANLGGRISNMRSFQRRSESELTELSIESTNMESVNIAEAITNLTQTQTGLQAALSAGARLGEMSLFNYLR
jgi:flagellar hook-associated protein 3